MKKEEGPVLLSYARADSETAKRIADCLKKAGIAYWDAERDLLPGSDFGGAIKEALEQAGAMVVLLSPEALQSRWVSHEIEYALGAKHLRGRLIPVMLRQTREVPWILRTLQMLRFETPEKTGQQIVELLRRPKDDSQTKRRAS